MRIDIKGPWSLCLSIWFIFSLGILFSAHSFQLGNIAKKNIYLSNERHFANNNLHREGLQIASCQEICQPRRTMDKICTMRLSMNAIEELFDENDNANNDDQRTDEEKGLTHGYEGSFKVGDKVRVKKHFKIFSVKAYSKEGFDPYNFCGVVKGLALYGRKYKTLCSAITPIIVEFVPEGEGIPPKMFEKKFQIHFEANELDLIV